MTGRALIVQGDALRLPLPDRSVDAVVCDPPYGLSREPDIAEVLTHWLAGDDYQHTGGGFMGRTWDSFVPGPSVWREAHRVLKPGGWLLAFGGTRTFDLLSIAIRMAGFEMRDTIAEFGPLAWLYGSGFPKSLDVSKDIDRMAGAEREVVGPVDRRIIGGRGTGTVNHGRGGSDQHPGMRAPTAPATPEAERWQGWGTALKPSWEPVIVARKPLSGTVAQNVLTFGTGALNIDAARIRTADKFARPFNEAGNEVYGKFQRFGNPVEPSGRWPPNVALVHSAGCQPTGTRKIRAAHSQPTRGADPKGVYGGGKGLQRPEHGQAVGYADADGMEEITAWTCQPDCPVALLDQQSGELSGASSHGRPPTTVGFTRGTRGQPLVPSYADQGGASRFFYTAKAGPNERVTIDGEGHPTVKPLVLMRWLCRLVCPPGGTILDMFAGSGTTGEAAMLEGFRCILIDKDPANLPSIRVRTHPYIRRTKIVTNGHQIGPEQGSLL